MIVINLFAGAGAGKSTLASSLFSELKKLGYKTELVGEFAKELVYQKAYPIMNDQLWLFANQAHRLRSLDNYGVEIAVCDSPLPLSIAYAKNESTSFYKLVLDEFNRYDNLNYILARNDGYWKMDGRTGDLNNAKEIDKVVNGIVGKMFHKTISPSDVDIILEDLKNM